jgi:hypothetical protein
VSYQSALPDPFHPLWLQSTTPGKAFRVDLINHLAQDFAGKPQSEKILEFRVGVADINLYVGTFDVDDEFQAALPGQMAANVTVTVFVGGAGLTATPVIIFTPDGKVYLGSLQASIDVSLGGTMVFNGNANLVAS